MKLTTEQLKQIIKEELNSVLSEDLPEQDEWWPILQDCIKSGKSEDECIDLAVEVYGRNWDDETIKNYMDYEYSNKPQKAAKSETDDINAWVQQNRETAERWNEFYNSFDSRIKWMANHKVAGIYHDIFGGEYPGSSRTRKLKRKVAAWRRKKGLEVNE